MPGGRENLPRPPAPIPLARPLGILGLIGALRHNPLEAWTQAHFESPIVMHDYRLGRIAIVNAPSAIRRVLLDNVQNYPKDGVQRRILGRTLQRGLLAAQGEDWRMQRRLIAPLFSARSVAEFAPAMHDAASDLVARWGDADGQVIDVAAEMAGVALDVLIRTIFCDGLGDSLEEWRKTTREYFDTTGRIHPFDVLGLPDFVPRLRRSRSRAIDAGIERLLAAHRASSRTEKTRDLLTLLIDSRDGANGQQLSEQEIKSNIFTFILAGHETTASAITWALYLLTLSPEWLAEVATEAHHAWDGPAAELTERLPKTRAVLDEALRLYPPLAAISRVAAGPDRLEETPIEAGMLIVIAPYVLHRHRLLWDDPDVFDPSRFLAGARSAIDRYAYLPFGAGPRVCIGAAFAQQEALFVLSAILRNFRFEVLPQHEVWPQQRVTLRPRGGLPMSIHCHDRNKSSL